MDALVNDKTDIRACDHRELDEFWTQIEWPVTTRHCVKPLFELMASLMLTKVDPSLLRLVFGFDS
jgi:hypothetical protein